MIILSTVISVIAFTTIVIVAIVVSNQTTTAKNQLEGKLKNIVDQVNTSQQYSYEFDKRQQQQVTGLERNVDDVRTSYITKTDAANSLTTNQLNAINVKGNKINLSGNQWNTGSINFNSDIDGASKSTDYLIQRGADPKDPLSKNQLIIRTPAEKGSAVNIQSSDGFSRMLIDSTTGQVTVPANIKTNSLQLGDKFKFSGVGDTQSNDSWLRLMDQNGTDFNGGFAAANLYTRDSATFNGITTLNGQINLNGKTNINNEVQLINGNTFRVDGAPGKQAISIGQTGSLLVDAPNVVGGRFSIKDNGNIGINQPNPQTKLDVGGDTNISGNFTVKKGNGNWNWANIVGNYNDNIYIGSDSGSRGIKAYGPKDFTIYNQDKPGLTVKQNGTVNIHNNLKINNNLGGWADNAALTTWTPDNTKIGASFGGPNMWSHFPWLDGNTYIRPGKNDGDINIDNANNITLQANKIRLNGNISTPNGNIIESDGRQHISAKELLYLLPKNGVVIGKEWGGTGSLNVQGNSTLDGNVNVNGALKLKHNLGDWTNKAALTAWTPDGNSAGPSFGGPDLWSHFPWFDGNTYIRPGKNTGLINIGDAGASAVNIGNAQNQVQLGANTFLPFKDGNSYIRPGTNGKNILIGDTWANEINIGRIDGSGSVKSMAKNTYVKQNIDAWDKQWDNNKTLFTGWNSDKVILGNNNSASESYLKTLPTNTVASANDMYVSGKLSTTNQLCINDTCLNEGDLRVLKSYV
jgi:hypothetical protein